MSNGRKSKVHVIGVPMDLGAGRRGVDMGPSAIRLAGLMRMLRKLGYEVIDRGDIAVPGQEARDPGEPTAKYLDVILQVCDDLRGQVRADMSGDAIPLVLGGDHSIAIGTVAGVSEHFQSQNESVGVLWIDAHADMNTPQSRTGNIHGMPLSTLLGQGPEPLVQLGGFAPKVDYHQVCLIGIRDLDESEKQIVRDSGVNAYTMREIDERGMRAVAEEAIAKASAAGTQASTCPSIWTVWIRTSRRGWARPSKAASTGARRTSSWRWWPTASRWSAWK